jgi:2-keto-4-pentenoate hydratase
MIAPLTKILLAQHAAGTTLDHLPPDLIPPDISAAYRIQNEVLDALGPVGAWKVSPFPDEGEPFCSPLPKSFVHQSGVRLPRDTFNDLGIEVEIAFTLGHDLKAGAGPNEARDAIGSVHIALELISSRYTDRSAVPRTAAFADLQSGGGIVLGEAYAFDGSKDFNQEQLTLTLDSADVATAQNGASTANALRALAWLANHAAARNLMLSKGTVIITGARIGPKSFSGEQAMGTSASFGTVEVGFG